MHAERVGKYELVRHLASGGMASVYLARLSGLGGFQRHVVLKTLRTHGLPDDGLVPMFLDEARLVATLHHQHIAQVFDVGRDADTYFLAMEYIHGETVRAVLETARKHGEALPLDFGLTIVCAAAGALHHAHERCGPGGAPLGIVHRDVTPSNVIVSYDGSIKLIDFGIAKANDRSTHTRSGFIKGKAGYMAPEQVKGYAVDRRSDVFALGVLAYELTTQHRAFHAESQFEQLARIANGYIAPPSELVDNYPVELEDVVMRALEVDPDDRYPDAAATRAAFAEVADRLGVGLNEAVIARVLHQLYGPRPEPWLVSPGDVDYDVTPSIADLPLPVDLEIHEYRAPSAITKVEGPGRDASPDPVDDALAAVSGSLVSDALGAVSGSVEIVSDDDIAIVADDSVVIDSALAPLEIEPTMPPRPAFAAGSTMSRLPPPIPVAVRPPVVRPPSSRPAPVFVLASQRGRRSPWPVVAIAGLAGAALAVAIGWYVTEPDAPAAHTAPGSSAAPARMQRDRPDVAAEPPGGSAVGTTRPKAEPPAAGASRQARDRAAEAPAAEPPATGPAPVTAERVTLEVITTPPNATVVLDGKRLGKTPYRAELPPRTKRSWLKVRKVGSHVPVQIRVDLSRDVSWHVVLPPLRK